MTGPFAGNSIVMDIETGQTEPCLQFDPDGLPGDKWLHRQSEYNGSLDRASVVDRYALPESDEYAVRVVEVPPGEKLRIGDIAAMHGRSGGSDLVEVIGYDSIPEAWIVETTSLLEFIE